ncbi:hypothetical protein LH464_20300 [Neorhizobium sp. T786]|uniref:hypothetical protein n=1 Tax=Pseudorhizobium xiangyangii TaxID=2883104 RepID=UPI001CFF67D5|nr:hypothetical protein [Neorhizobium xiangyangii]MCB5204810.1 hypothetical protein [Neorhizobium xiangyangii]
MNRKATVLSALGLICITATGCVSGGGSYVAYESRPQYDRIDNNHRRPPPPPHGGRHDRDDRRDWRHDNDRNDRGGRPDRDGWRNQAEDRRDSDRPHASRPDHDRDGRWIIRDGRRVWVSGR